VRAVAKAASTLVYWGPIVPAALSRLWMSNTTLEGSDQAFYAPTESAYAAGALLDASVQSDLHPPCIARNDRCWRAFTHR
jgi:hypothetical protein